MKNSTDKKSIAQLEIHSLNRLEVKHIQGGTTEQLQDIVIIDIIAP